MCTLGSRLLTHAYVRTYNVIRSSVRAVHVHLCTCVLTYSYAYSREFMYVRTHIHSASHDKTTRGDHYLGNEIEIVFSAHI